MLPKSRRIPRADFQKILSFGKRFDSPHFSLRVFSADKNSGSKFSFSVSKKIKKLAADRNRLRRRGYAIVGKSLKNIETGFFCFFSFKKTENTIPFSVLGGEVVDLLREANVLR